MQTYGICCNMGQSFIVDILNTMNKNPKFWINCNRSWRLMTGTLIKLLLCQRNLHYLENRLNVRISTISRDEN